MASDNGDPAGTVRVPAFERRARMLLRAYPAAYRHERAEEIIGTLLEATPANRTWPRPRDARALIAGGLKIRATHNRHLTIMANLRVAVMLGVALYLAAWVASYLGGAVASAGSASAAKATFSAWPTALTGILIAASVVLSWLAPRFVALCGAVLAAAAVIYLAAPYQRMEVAGIIQVICLAALVALPPRASRPPRAWLWLVGALGVAEFVPTAIPGYVSDVWLYDFERWLPLLLLIIVAVASIVWVGINAQPVIAMLTFIVVWLVQSVVTTISFGAGAPVPVPLVLIIAAISAPAVWLLRRQSAGGVTAGAR